MRQRKARSSHIARAMAFILSTVYFLSASIVPVSAAVGNGNCDLVVIDIITSPANPQPGDQVTLSAVIKNNGPEATPADVKHGVRFSIDNLNNYFSWNDQHRGSIAPGATVTLQATGGVSGTTWTAGSGSYKLIAWINDDLSINENNTNNNVYEENIQINGGGSGNGSADLIVTDITTSPADPQPGDQVTLSAVIKNIGQGATPSGVKHGVRFSIDTLNNYFSWNDQHFGSIAPGASVTLQASGGVNGTTWTPGSEGLYELIAWVNDDLSVSESNTNNNVYQETIQIGNDDGGGGDDGGGDNDGPSDLVVTDIIMTPADPRPGQAVTLSAVVKNNGGATQAGVKHGVRFSIDTLNNYFSWNDQYFGPIAAGASVTLQATGGVNGTTWTPEEEGEYTLIAWVNDGNPGQYPVAESNYDNNVYEEEVTIEDDPTGGICDLVIESVGYRTSSPREGVETALTATVRNNGVNPSSKFNTVDFYHDGVFFETVTMSPKIQPGGTLVFTSEALVELVLGDHVISAVVNNNRISEETNYNNNSLEATATVTVRPDDPVVPTPSPEDVGAAVPYHRYEADEGTYGGGAVLQTAPYFEQNLIASEASGQKYVSLPSAGSYVQWTIRNGGGGDGINMRFTMPDSSNGMGLDGSLDIYVNGTKVPINRYGTRSNTINLSSYWSWQYFNGDQPSDAPGGAPRFRFDEVHFMLDTPLVPGDVVKIQNNAGDHIYGVDFIEVEQVPNMVDIPVNAVSVVDFGAIANDGRDDLDEFMDAVAEANRLKKDVYIPEGKFELGQIWHVGAQDITITGAGMWYTNIHFTSPNQQSGGISGENGRASSNLEFGNVYLSSMLRSRYNQQAVYKCFMDSWGNNSRIFNVWEEHFECGFWIGDYNAPYEITSNLMIENCRIRNNLADGVNFCVGTNNSTVFNCSVRNNGDDALACWPDNFAGAGQAYNNTFKYNTIENNWRAAAIAIFGGDGHKIHNNYVKDSFKGSAIRLNTTFPGHHFDNMTQGILFKDMIIETSGTSFDCYGGERGAIDLEASGGSINNITFDTILIKDSPRSAIQFCYGSGFSNIKFKNITVDKVGLDGDTHSRFSQSHSGKVLYSATNNGSVDVCDFTILNVDPEDYVFIQNGFGVTGNAANLFS